MNDVSQAIHVSLPDEFDTIGGFVIDLLGHIPDDDEQPSVSWGQVEFTILEMDDRRVLFLNVKRIEDEKYSSASNEDLEERT